MKKKMKAYTFCPNIYPFDVVFAFDADFESLSKRYEINIEAKQEFDEFANSCFALTLDAVDLVKRKMCIVIVTFRKIGIKTMSHEATHAVDFMFERMRMDTGVSCTEPRAYLTGWVTGAYEKAIAANKKGIKSSEIIYSA